MAKIRCKDCNAELVATDIRGSACNCDNHAYIHYDRHGQVCISATDLDRVELIEGVKEIKKSPRLIEIGSKVEKRKVRKLDFEIR